jgi:cell division protein FtsB
MGIRSKLTWFFCHHRPRKVGAALYTGRRRVATLGMGLIALWLSYHVVFGSNGMLVYNQKRSDFNRLQQEIEVLQKENSRYTQDIKALKSDPEAIEREAREQLQYAKPGEVVYVLPTGAAGQKPATATAKR